MPDENNNALLFSSGMASATHLLLALGPGSHILAPETMYWFLRSWMTKQAPALGLEISLYPNGDLDAVKAGIRPVETKAVWAETPSNPDWSIMDIAACGDIHNRPIRVGWRFSPHSLGFNGANASFDRIQIAIGIKRNLKTQRGGLLCHPTP